jgi:phosphatidylethanolamine/phosphatidyl-N-methylethanolamine N-methyltransferase
MSTPVETRDVATSATRRRYDSLARTYDLRQRLVERLIFRGWRRALWSRVGSGSVLEVGVGTGASFDSYPPGTQIVAVDLSEQMLGRARSRAEREEVSVDLRVMDVQRLDFPDASFDWVVGTFVFCSVPDPVLGLSEVRRVLKPGGIVLLLEHVRGPGPLGPLMDLMNPMMLRISGANMNRRTLSNVEAAGLEVLREERRVAGIFRFIEAGKGGDGN